MVRLKNRYIVVEINPQFSNRDNKIQPFRLQDKVLNQAIQSEVQLIHGDFGVASIRSGFQVKYCNDLTRIAIIRCTHGPHKLVTSVLPLITNLPYLTAGIFVNILYTGATLKQCFNFIKTHQERKYNEFCACLKSEEEKNELRNAVLNFETILNKLTN
ncbi:hypothetical protein ABEB36_009927 [Hypothenemus hampei]|uniref:Ribonuclease P/MRP protein subunit POP5 n=1 Tax=Hypothenemus hampei TaxID=57062 RepID=A0ABD1EI15_HYPHA